MGRCNICGQVNGHTEGCPNGGNEVQDQKNNNREAEICCGFCGTMNSADSKKCRGCNAPLEGSVVIQKNNDTVKSRHTPERENGGSSVARMPTQPEDEDRANHNVCPKCGYVLRAGANFCPSCKTPINQPVIKGNGEAKRNGTTPVWNVGEKHSFSIGLCDKNGEISDAKTYTTEDVVLGRNELAPNDNSISRQHIHITNENGKWFIEDASSTHQTYLVVKGKAPIENGDVLVLGNKFFRFETE